VFEGIYINTRYDFIATLNAYGHVERVISFFRCGIVKLGIESGLIL